MVCEPCTQGWSAIECLTVNNDPVIWTMLNAIKELNAKVDKKEAENADLKARLERLEKLINSNHGVAP
jgi:hypothetical protein